MTLCVSTLSQRHKSQVGSSAVTPIPVIMSLRKLKYHEQKLLKKVDFLWQHEGNLREAQILRRYNIKNREDYVKYNRLCGKIKKLTNMLKGLEPNDKYRIKVRSSQIVEIESKVIFLLVFLPRIFISFFLPCRRQSKCSTNYMKWVSSQRKGVLLNVRKLPLLLLREEGCPLC